ncbi:MAG: hypothetical protein H6646_09005 [Anaerolineales bacterium]|nr:hypothetical protein [Anaerolineales bacterium]
MNCQLLLAGVLLQRAQKTSKLAALDVVLQVGATLVRVSNWISQTLASLERAAAIRPSARARKGYSYPG